jgi:hypothetical protein
MIWSTMTTASLNYQQSDGSSLAQIPRPGDDTAEAHRYAKTRRSIPTQARPALAIAIALLLLAAVAVMRQRQGQ